MLITRHKETILRNADNISYAIDVDIELYKAPLTTKEVMVKENPTDSEPTIKRNKIDWDNSNKLGSERVQWLIPTNKQTNTYSANSGETFTDYDTLSQQWRELYSQNGDIIRVEEELREKHKAHDGVVSS
tara:strand:- start:90 stop:479 length:390 start_codon:yes stop_codon:yes gene_type:complete